MKFADLIMPLPLPGTFTYSVPEHLSDCAVPGKRAVVQFGKRKIYAGVISKIHYQQPEGYKVKPVIEILDDKPVITDNQLQLWRWIAAYYMTTPGEVMQAALPAGLKLDTETRLILNPAFEDKFDLLNDEEYLIAEALTIQHELTIDEIRKILDKKKIYPVINSLINKQAILVGENWKERYQPKKEKFVRLAKDFSGDKLKSAFDLLNQAPKQTELLMAFIDLSKKKGDVYKKQLLDRVNTSPTVLKGLQEKGVFEIIEEEVNRLQFKSNGKTEVKDLNDEQQRALKEINKTFETNRVTLLHGVTSSGKTEVYIQLIKNAISEGKQVLYLLPEIALTAQIINRLQRALGSKAGIYHSKFNDNERVEIWNKVKSKEYQVILGARSALFLPFSDLNLIIVDEEHDSSYKQFDPAPRYQARDTAVFLAGLYNAKVLLGTATPSLESYYNAHQGKYGFVSLTQRFGGAKLPEVHVVDLKEEQHKKKLKENFSSYLLDKIKTALENNEQVILFQNRRGYAPFLVCGACGLVPSCKNCDVSLTYHKYTHELKCHYCGYIQKELNECPACTSSKIFMQGFGTEKIEDDLKQFFPKAVVQRMDYDSVRKKTAHNKIINDFEQRRINILVGTQMVTKGLDFDNVAVVGVLSAESLINFPDFRANERAFQLMAQVSGRAGRKRRGEVIIQAFQPDHYLLKQVAENDYQKFYKKELVQRRQFKYPPFYRFIKIRLRHKYQDRVNKAAGILFNELSKVFGENVLGPVVPYIDRVRQYYRIDILIRLDRKKTDLSKSKLLIIKKAEKLQQYKSYRSVRVQMDVDPY